MKKIIITIDDDGRFVDITTEEVGVKTEEEVIKKDTFKEVTGYSIYARVFDDGCPGWNKDPEYNLIFLKQIEGYANELLRSRGYIFLNEVYDMLGIPRTKAGQTVGWVYNEKDPIGDNRVDFGIFNTDSMQNRDFINGYVSTIVLDFNVDGDILDKLI